MSQGKMNIYPDTFLSVMLFDILGHRKHLPITYHIFAVRDCILFIVLSQKRLRTARVRREQARTSLSRNFDRSTKPDLTIEPPLLGRCC